MLLLNIVSGQPHQTQLPITLRQRTVKMEEYSEKPVLGRCYDNNTFDSINDLINSQDSLLQNLDKFIETQDHY